MTFRRGMSLWHGSLQQGAAFCLQRGLQNVVLQVVSGPGPRAVNIRERSAGAHRKYMFLLSLTSQGAEHE
jgi:hypothetical protein